MTSEAWLNSDIETWDSRANGLEMSEKLKTMKPPAAARADLIERARIHQQAMPESRDEVEVARRQRMVLDEPGLDLQVKGDGPVGGERDRFPVS
jgi:hypothetical protein